MSEARACAVRRIRRPICQALSAILKPAWNVALRRDVPAAMPCARRGEAASSRGNACLRTASGAGLTAILVLQSFAAAGYKANEAR